jgi:NADP-dependent 3-hydroxy acid dehydrogenase YdfG
LVGLVLVENICDSGLCICAGNTLHYRQIDVRDVQGLNTVVKSISDAQGRLDGLIAAAGIQQETSALDYTQADANMMFEVNVTGE